MKIGRAAAVLAALGMSGAAAAQDYDAIINQQLGLMNQQAAQWRQMEAGIVQQNLRNPAVQQAYQRHLAQGGRMSAEQYAYYWGATGGDAAQGRAAFAASETANRQREHQAWQGYQGAVQARGQAQQQMNNRFSANQQEAGRVLQGNASYYDGGAGTTVVLPYIQHGQLYQDPRSGRTYGMDGNGQYWAAAPNGTWYPVNPR